MEKIDKSELLIKGITHIGRARSNHKQNPKEALRDLKFGAELINESVELSPDDLFLRKERAGRFLGITLNSPLDLLDTVLEDIEFFRERLNLLNSEYRSFYSYLTGVYNVYYGDKSIGVESLGECIQSNKNSLESKEAATILASILCDLK